MEAQGRKILRVLKEQKAEEFQLIEIGGGREIFAQEYEKLSNRKVLVIEPGPESAAASRQKGV